MGLFDLFKNKDKVIKKLSPAGLKWISISLVIYFTGTKKEIEKITEDILDIINNTHSILNSKGELRGHVNPYLGINLASGFIKEKGSIRHVTSLYPITRIPAHSYLIPDSMAKDQIVTLDLSRPFTGIIKKMDKDNWKLTFVPIKTNKEDKTNLYSLPNLHHDFWELAAASDFICEKYNIAISQEEPTFNPLILDGAPALEFHDHLIIITYHLHDRVVSAQDYPELDDAVFKSHGSPKEIINKIGKAEPNSEWAKIVKTRFK